MRTFWDTKNVIESVRMLHKAITDFTRNGMEMCDISSNGKPTNY